jgi:hypothetical protein
MRVEVRGIAIVARGAGLLRLVEKDSRLALDLKLPQAEDGTGRNDSSDEQTDQKRIVDAVLLHVLFLRSLKR